MHTFTVWAPDADRVDVVIAEQRHPMSPATPITHHRNGGWWEGTVSDAGLGTRYAFSLDGGPPRPDPRSASQPDGPHGPSELVDHAAFAWSDDRWRGLALPGSILYELHVGTFTPEGTFEAVITRLPHLVELGVDAIELMPVAEFAGERGWGYDGVNLFAPHHAYGGPEGLKRLVDACHSVGLGVVFDVVYNHLGPSGNYLPEFGPYFTDRHTTLWGDAVNFDGPGSDAVRRYVIDNARMWLHDYHGDGLRLDAVHAIVDDSAIHILEEIATEIAALGAQLRRPLFLIAESDRNDPILTRERDVGGGYGLQAAWADDWHHAIHAALTGETNGYYADFGALEHAAKAMRQAWVYDGAYSQHRQRHHGRPPAGLTGDRFVVSVQNHDQVGNRAHGDRLGHLTTLRRVKIAAALLLTSPFTPLLFQGEEWAASAPFQYFTDHQEPELGRAISAGRCREFTSFGWDPADVPDPQDPATFKRSQLDWDERRHEPHADILEWYGELIDLRRRIPALSDPRLDQVDAWCEGPDAIVVRRANVVIAVNLGAAPREFATFGPVAVLAASAPEVTIDGAVVVVPPDTVAILESWS